MSVVIHKYSKNFSKLFWDEKERLVKLLPATATIEHVGSSAVGIGGKNIIDILIGVSNAQQMNIVRDILVKNGYFEGHDNHQDRLFLASSVQETDEGDFHIHICPVSSDAYKDFITLRDFLGQNPDKASEYNAKKRDFARQAKFDRKKYKALKSQYVSRLLREAKKRFISTW